MWRHRAHRECTENDEMIWVWESILQTWPIKKPKHQVAD
jgi:hypothetical protein